jgi:4-oxalocrotonate tautomerase
VFQPERHVSKENASMPVVTIKLARRDVPTSREQKAALIAGMTQLLVDVLAKRAEDVTVLIDEIDPDNWGQGGESATMLREKRRARKPE